MFALLNNKNIVVDWCWENDLDKFPDLTPIKMTLDNSPAVINGKWDGQKFIHPLDLEMENA
jgi:hypothetical protein